MTYSVRLVDWGVGYSQGDLEDGVVEINRKLLQYPELYDLVLEHELKHLASPGFWGTVRIDLADLFDFKKQRLLSSCLGTGSKLGLQASLPIWRVEGRWSVNLFLLVFYAVSASLLSAGMFWVFRLVGVF